VSGLRNSDILSRPGQNSKAASNDQLGGSGGRRAQLKLLRDYAIRNDFSVVKEFVDIETAKTSEDRTSVKWCSFSRKIASAASYWSKKPTACTVIFATPSLWKIWTWKFTW
jgi:hypothetical protein